MNTKEFTTEGGHKIITKEYATGRVFQEIQNVYLEGAKINIVGQQTSVEGFNPTADYEATKKMIELMVISVDDKNSNVVDDILELPVPDYQEVVDYLNEITGKKKVNESESQ